jgi:serine phosphatase RsbU (regulator of sigma subunit)
MSLRIRLVLAFFLLSVVPLAAVTVYSYTSNVEALRVAAEHEADLLAGELGQRMTLVTAQLSERVEHLMDIAELQSAADTAIAQQAAASPVAPATATVTLVTPSAKTAAGATPVDPNALSNSLAKSLGEAAMLLNNVRLQNMRGGGGGGRGGGRGTLPPGVVPPPPSLPTVGRAIPTSPMTPTPTPTPARPGSARPAPTGSPMPAVTPAVNPATLTPAATLTPSATPRPTPPGGGTGEPPRGRGPRQGQGGGRGFTPPRSGGGGAGSTPTPQPQPTSGTPRPTEGPATSPAPGGPGAPAAPGQPPTITPIIDASGNLTIDMGPLRRDLIRQVLPPDKRYEDLTSEERQRLAAEVNQRLVGIQQGLQIGAAELQKRALEAEREAGAKAAAAKAAAAKPVPAPMASTAAPSDLKRRSSLTGSSIAVNVERNGEVVRSINAEINLPNVLATVFSTTRRDRGEVPFAVARDGTIYTRTDAEKARVTALGDVAKPNGPAIVRLSDWIVVTTQDTSGSGLRLGIARPVGDSLANLQRTTVRNAGLGLLFIVVALVGIVPLSTRLTRNFTVLSDAVGRIAHGDYGARVPVNSNDETGHLARAFNQMAADVERHKHTAVEQERIRRELELGRQIQAEMLPHAPLNQGLVQVQGVSVPAREVGGDFFNYFVLDDGQIALLMGDVSGKGVGAALLMANIQASLKVRLGLGQGLSAVADALDRDIEANSPGPVYATLFIAMLDPASRRLRYVNAGHNPQYALRRDGRLERMAATGLPVGLLAGRGYTEQTVQLEAGDRLFLYTDGCVEEENERGEMFGQERLESLLRASAQSADPLVYIEDALTAYRGKTEPMDDATLMTVKIG